MSIHVTTQMKTRAEHTNQVIEALRQALPDSLQHEGCEAIHLRQEQDNPTNIVSFTRWATRKNYEDYLAWRTETGMTVQIDALLTEPLAPDGARPSCVVGYAADRSSRGRRRRVDWVSAGGR